MLRELVVLAASDDRRIYVDSAPPDPILPQRPALRNVPAVSMAAQRFGEAAGQGVRWSEELGGSVPAFNYRRFCRDRQFRENHNSAV